MMRSCESPHSSASSAERMALCTIASMVTSRASRGSAVLAFSSISSVSSCWSSDPQFTPIRTGLPLATATSTIWRKWASWCLEPTLPGLIRYLASACAHPGYLLSARRASRTQCAPSLLWGRLRRRGRHGRPRSPKLDRARCPTPGGAVECDGAAPDLDQAARDRQAQPRTARRGGERRLELPRQGLRGVARSL